MYVFTYVDFDPLDLYYSPNVVTVKEIKKTYQIFYHSVTLFGPFLTYNHTNSSNDNIDNKRVAVQLEVYRVLIFKLVKKF